MTTNLDSIPLKTSNKNNDIPNDDSDDPIVKDILSEFQQEFEINTKKPISLNLKENYNINYETNDNCNNNNECKIPPKKNKNELSLNTYYNQEYIKKAGIIGIIVFIIFSPLVLPSLFEKLPFSISSIIENYDIYIRTIILSIIIYLAFIFNLI